MMTKLNAILLTASLSLSSVPLFAATVDNNDVVPPAQIQKDQVPNSTSNGNYLEPQPDENGATTNTNGTTNSNADKQYRKDKKAHKGSKPTNLEKSKRFESPENGGTTVNPSSN
jgi:hypothetical protein